MDCDGYNGTIGIPVFCLPAFWIWCSAACGVGRSGVYNYHCTVYISSHTFTITSNLRPMDKESCDSDTPVFNVYVEALRVATCYLPVNGSTADVSLLTGRSQLL